MDKSIINENANVGAMLPVVEPDQVIEKKTPITSESINTEFSALNLGDKDTSNMDTYEKYDDLILESLFDEDADYDDILCEPYEESVGAVLSLGAIYGLIAGVYAIPCVIAVNMTKQLKKIEAYYKRKDKNFIPIMNNKDVTKNVYRLNRSLDDKDNPENMKGKKIDSKLSRIIFSGGNVVEYKYNNKNILIFAKDAKTTGNGYVTVVDTDIFIKINPAYDKYKFFYTAVVMNSSGRFDKRTVNWVKSEYKKISKESDFEESADINDFLGYLCQEDAEFALDDFDENSYEPYEEGANLDVRRTYKIYVKLYKSAIKKASKAYNQHKYGESNKYAKDAYDAITKCIKIIDATEPELFSSLIGYFARGILDMLKYTLLFFIPFKIVRVAVKLRDLIRDITGIIHNIKANNGLSISIIDKYRNRILGICVELQKNASNLIAVTEEMMRSDMSLESVNESVDELYLNDFIDSELYEEGAKEVISKVANKTGKPINDAVNKGTNAIAKSIVRSPKAGADSHVLADYNNKVNKIRVGLKVGAIVAGEAGIFFIPIIGSSAMYNAIVVAGLKTSEDPSDKLVTSKLKILKTKVNKFHDHVKSFFKKNNKSEGFKSEAEAKTHFHALDSEAVQIAKEIDAINNKKSVAITESGGMYYSLLTDIPERIDTLSKESGLGWFTECYNGDFVIENEENPFAFLEDGDSKRDIDDDIKPIIKKLNDKGYKTKYSCSGHPSARVKGDVYKDGIKDGKVYSTARVVFAKAYDFPSIPKYWEKKVLDDGKVGIYVKAPSFNIINGIPENQIAKLKKRYMYNLEKWVDQLPEESKLKKDDNAKVSLESCDDMDELLNDIMIDLI